LENIKKGEDIHDETDPRWRTGQQIIKFWKKTKPKSECINGEVHGNVQPQDEGSDQSDP